MHAAIHATALLVLAAIGGSSRTGEQAPRSEAPMKIVAIAIPASMQAEHNAIHSALVQATKAAGSVGKAAQTVAEVLHPHFIREEQIALPPLGLLARLSSNAHVTDAEASEVLAMTDALRRELPRMLEEHQRIRQAVDALRSAATAAHATSELQLSADLALHAQTEEEVLYPAALLVGDAIRRRR